MEKPKIKLYFYFPDKKRFDFDRETYDCSVLFINVSGSFQYRINNSAPAIAKPGDIIYCPPQCSFQRKTITPIEMHMVKFEGTLPRGEYVINSRIRDDLKAISHISLALHPEEDPLLAHYLRDIIYTLTVKSSGSQAVPIIKYMDENYHLPISNAALCKIIHCSEVSLIAQVKALTGKTPKQYINERRIERAKEILLSSDISVSEAAVRCGFEDPLYFSKAFSKATGMSPSRFKSKYRI